MLVYCWYGYVGFSFCILFMFVAQPVCFVTNRVRVFGFKKGKPLALLNYHSATVNAVAFTPGCGTPAEHSNLLACGSKDERISLWRLYWLSPMNFVAFMCPAYSHCVNHTSVVLVMLPPVCSFVHSRGRQHRETLWLDVYPQPTLASAIVNNWSNKSLHSFLCMVIRSLLRIASKWKSTHTIVIGGGRLKCVETFSLCSNGRTVYQVVRMCFTDGLHQGGYRGMHSMCFNCHKDLSHATSTMVSV